MKNKILNQPFILTVLLGVFSGILFAQPRMTSETRFIIQDVETSFKVNGTQSESWKKITTQYPVYNDQGEWILSFIGKRSAGFNRASVLNAGHIIGSEIGDIFTLRVKVRDLSSVFNLNGISYLEVAGKASPDLDRLVFDTRVDSVHKGLDLPEAYTGKDVLIGITDWGFDYTSPMFYDTLLTETRIHSAWDQFKTSGPAPAGYTYGAAYTGDANLIAAETDTFNFYQRSTHGTHVAGIAGGSGAGKPYRGVAFEAEFLMVTFRIDQASVLDAFSWMKSIADAENKRLVINMSWGLYYFGTLDGNSLTSQAIDQLSGEGVIFSNSAGNNGNVNFHIKKSFNADTLRSRVNFYTYTDPNFVGESVNMWGEPDHSFKSQIRFLDNSNTVVGSTPLFNTESDTMFIDTLLTIGSDTIWYKLGADAAHPLNGRPHMRFRVINKTSYRTVLISYADSGTVHYWNVAEMQWGEGNWGQAFTSLGSGYVNGDRNYGIGEPAVTKSLITVAAHSPEYRNGVGNIVGGQFASFSSFGPTMDGRMKPDISAPGNNICSSISSFTTNSVTAVTSVSFNNRNYPFAKLSGTSMSSPAVAGVVALMLDANPFLTAQQVKDIIILTAREDNYTGDVPDSGSTQWGHGKINAHYAILMALNTVNIHTYADHGFMVFPNPADENIFIVTNPQWDENASATICSINGSVVASGINNLSAGIPVNNLAPGIYILSIVSNGEIFHSRFIKS